MLRVGEVRSLLTALVTGVVGVGEGDGPGLGGLTCGGGSGMTPGGGLHPGGGGGSLNAAGWTPAFGTASTVPGFSVRISGLARSKDASESPRRSAIDRILSFLFTV